MWREFSAFSFHLLLKHIENVLEKEFLEKNNFFFISLYSTLYFRCANRLEFILQIHEKTLKGFRSQSCTILWSKKILEEKMTCLKTEGGMNVKNQIIKGSQHWNFFRTIRTSKVKKITTLKVWSERQKWPTYGVWPS